MKLPMLQNPVRVEVAIVLKFWSIVIAFWLKILTNEAFHWLFLSLVSVLATNRSCLLVRTLLHFAGFHRQPSSALLRGLLYLQVCKSCIASGIELKIMTFRMSSLYFLFCALLYFSEDKKYFCILHYWFSQATVTAYLSTSLASSRKSSTCETFMRARRLLLRRLELFVGIGAHISEGIDSSCASC